MLLYACAFIFCSLFLYDFACHCCFAYFFYLSHSNCNRNIKFNSKWVQSINFISNALKCKNVGTPLCTSHSSGYARAQETREWEGTKYRKTKSMHVAHLIRVTILTIIYIRFHMCCAMMMHQIQTYPMAFFLLQIWNRSSS